jgi:hypothetical protein
MLKYGCSTLEIYIRTIKHYILISNQLLITDFEFKFKIDREISEK